MNRERFTVYSQPIDLRLFARESKRLLVYGDLFAVFFHAGLVLLMPPRERPAAVVLPVKPERIIHVGIIVIQPQPAAPGTS